MTERLIHKSKFDDKPHILKTSLIFVADDKICDGCDRRSKCASISLVSGGISILCQDCIEGILESLDPSSLRDSKIDRILK